MWAKGIVDRDYYAVPWLDGRAVPTNDYGNVPNTFYSAVLQGLNRFGMPKKSDRKSYDKYFSVPDRRIGPAVRRMTSFKPGIYRAKGSQVDFLFGYARRNPTVRTIFDFSGFTFRRAEQLLPTLLSQELEKAMR